MTAIGSTATGSGVEIGTGLIDSWVLSLRAARKSPKTIDTYTEAVEQFGAFLTERGMPSVVDAIRREHVESFIVELLKRGKTPATANNRYRGLAAFFKWLKEERLRDRPRLRRHGRPARRTSRTALKQRWL